MTAPSNEPAQRLREHLRDLVFKMAGGIRDNGDTEIDAIIAAVVESIKGQKPEVPPYPVESKDLQMLHDGAVQGFQDALDTVTQILDGMVKG